MKGWATRRANLEHERRSAAAKKGWQTRQTKDSRSNWLVNDDEPGAGDYLIPFNARVHPIHGKGTKELKEWQRNLKPYIGHRVVATFNGFRIYPDSGERKSFRITRVGMLHNYAAMFGSGGVYQQVIKAILSVDSDGDIVIKSITLRYATKDDTNSEKFGPDVAAA